jgi:hypothetical protein
MKICTKCKENKNLSEFYKQKNGKDGVRADCKACIKVYSANRYSMAPEKINAKNRAWQKANREKVKINRALYYEANSEELKAKSASWRDGNLEKVKSTNGDYKKNNPGKIRALRSKRRAQKLNATPKWLTKEQLLEIETFYIEAVRLTKETGIKHVVDHIIPLQGKNVRGLHVPWNLQILTESKNCSKGNRLP